MLHALPLASRAAAAAADTPCVRSAVRFVAPPFWLACSGTVACKSLGKGRTAGLSLKQQRGAASISGECGEEVWVGQGGCERGRCDAVGQGLKWDNRAKNWGLEGYRRPGEGQRAQARKTVQAGPGEENGWRAGSSKEVAGRCGGEGKLRESDQTMEQWGQLGGSRRKAPGAGEGAVGVPHGGNARRVGLKQAGRKGTRLRT